MCEQDLYLTKDVEISVKYKEEPESSVVDNGTIYFSHILGFQWMNYTKRCMYKVDMSV